MKNKTVYIIAASIIGFSILLRILFSDGSDSQNSKNGQNISKQSSNKISLWNKLTGSGKGEVVRNYTSDDMGRKQLKRYIKEHEQKMKFPDYSMPLSNNDHDLLNPLEFIPVKRVFGEDKDFSYYAKLSSVLLFKGEAISVEFTIISTNPDRDVPIVQMVQAEIVDIDKGQKIRASFDLIQSKSVYKKKEFKKTFQPTGNYSSWGEAMTLKITFQMGSFDRQVIASTFYYADKSAEVIGIDKERVSGPHLVIPVNLKVFSKGLYKISANLFSENSGLPIAHLYGIKECKEGRDKIILKAHATVLREQKDPGPYVLKSMTVIRLSSVKKGQGYGKGGKKTYIIGRHNLSHYSNEPYVNKEEEDKMKKLKELLQ